MTKITNPNQIPHRPIQAADRTGHHGPTRGAATLLGLLLVAGSVHAQSILVPNGSFESPKPPQGFPATPQIDDWQKSAQPDGVQLPGGLTWAQLSGVFLNTPSGDPDHIDNMVGSQGAYLFTIPGVGLFQTLNATFEVGNAYTLSVGALGGGGISEGSILELSLFWIYDVNSVGPVAVTPITYTAAGFPTTPHLVEFTAESGIVAATHPWAGKQIALQLMSSAGTGSGYWDVDNVRLSVVPEPGSAALVALGLGSLLVARAGFNRRVKKET